MKSLLPLDTTPLFAPLHQELLALLCGLSEEAWERPTIAGRWRVREVAAHLLDGQLRTLSALRDGHLVPPEEPVEGYRDLVGFLNRLNREWIQAAERLSPAVLVELLAFSGPAVAEYFSTLDLEAPALFSVSWAGEEESKNWLHIGREYTEWWHHQMQIRDAVGATAPLLETKWLAPLLDISLRVLPHSYREVEAAEGSAVVFAVEEWVWTLQRQGYGWALFTGSAAEPAARLEMDGDTAWRLFYNALSAGEAQERVTVAGEEALLAPLWGSRSVMV